MNEIQTNSNLCVCMIKLKRSENIRCDWLCTTCLLPLEWKCCSQQNDAAILFIRSLVANNFCIVVLVVGVCETMCCTMYTPLVYTFTNNLPATKLWIVFVTSFVNTMNFHVKAQCIYMYCAANFAHLAGLW